MRTFIITFLLMAACFAALGQGQVQFRTYYANSTPPVNAPVTSCFTGFPLDGSNPLCRAALIGGPTTATPASGSTPGTLSMMYNPYTTTLTWVNFRSAPNAGFVSVVNPQRVVPGVNWGGQALVQMVVWQGNYDTWTDAFAAWQAGTAGVLIGVSNPLTLTLPASPTSPNLTYLTGLQPFCLGSWPPPPQYFNGSAGPYDATVNVGDTVLLQVTADASPPPDSYQWYFNGNAIPQANSATLYLPSVRSVDAGQYYVTMHHVLGTFTSRTATLTVHVPAVITSAPQSQTAVAGSGAVFRAGATGDAPLTYQWYFNGSAPVGNGTSLKLSALQPQHVGAYTVVVGNPWSSVTSAPAMLNVIPPVHLTLVPGIVGHAQNGIALNLEYAEGLGAAMNWQALAEMAPGTNASQVYVDWPAAAQYRFYRGWQTNGVSQAPVLSMELVPAITLMGAVGSSIRVDYINQVGPIDAWVTVATVPLTNTAQVFFDTSARGQPPRLYRLVTGP